MKVLTILTRLFTSPCVQRERKYVYPSVSVCHHPQPGQILFSQHLPAVQINSCTLKLCTVAIAGWQGQDSALPQTNKQSRHFLCHLSLSADACGGTVDPIVLPRRLQRQPQLQTWVTLVWAWSVQLCDQNPRQRNLPFDTFTFTIHHGLKSISFSLSFITLFVPSPSSCFLSSVLLIWHCCVTSGTGQTFPSRWPMSSHNKDIRLH